MSDDDLDETHDPHARSWVPGATEHPDFPLANLPLGVVAGRDGVAYGALRIADVVVPLGALADAGLLADPAANAAAQAGRGAELNALFALGSGPRRALRRAAHALLSEGSEQRERTAVLLRPLPEVCPQLPARIGDYTDFYVGIHHAEAVGAIFRPDNPLLPNYRWVPIGYHGRASSVVPTGTGIRRPHGQVLMPGSGEPTFVPTARLDYEFEVGIWVAAGNPLGSPTPIAEAANQVAGYCLLNDWSARDVQSWEYQPLGPFLAKNFATTVSTWVVSPEALAPYRIAALARGTDEPAPLAYLDDPSDQATGGLDITLEVLLQTAAMRAAGHAWPTSSTRHMYWTPAQMVTHHTSGGCDLRPGDLLGTGTLSGPGDGERGSLLEATGGGRTPINLPGGEQRLFLDDGDEVLLRARAARPGAAPIGFGECRGVVLPA